MGLDLYRGANSEANAESIQYHFMLTTQPQSTMTDTARHIISGWLCLCLLAIALMVVIGGLTRLTESGLSIIEWKPIAGIVPPLDDTAFQKEFDDYQTSPQFKKLFPNMTLPEFKHIYWLEYIHRLIGRVAGVLFLVPLLCFAFTRVLPWKKALKLGAIFALGGLQGGIGWYMVQTGLIDNPHVSSYSLSLHLAMGFLLFGLVLWQTLSFSHSKITTGGFELPSPPHYLKIFACLVVTLISLQVIVGAIVAGLHAGFTYNTFPRMDGQWIPEGLWSQDTWYKNIFEDVATIQFIHRMMAYIVSLAVMLFWIIGRNNPHIAHLLPILFSILVVQFLLGVLTLLFVVPIPLASLHQANALLLFGIAVTILHRLFIPFKTIAYEIDGKSAFA